MTYGIIYKATNLVNGKIYIGQTVEDLPERVRKHLYEAHSKRDSNVVFHRAIRKYGDDNFLWDIIDYADSKQELDVKEEYWINKYNSHIHIKKSNGYNMTFGGEGSEGYKHTEEAIQKMSNIQKERFKNKENCPMYGKNHTEESKQKISEARKKLYTGENHPWHGRKHSDESKQKMRESSKGVCAGKENYQAKTIIQLTLDNVFVAKHDTIRDSAKSVNGHHSAISRCCSGHRGKHKGFKWMFEEDYLALEK